MSFFINENFLLSNEISKELYYNYASNLPIIDYHCHLPPSEISKNKKFKDITELWIENDHYKWRALRTLGVNEEYITGKANSKDKFKKWASSIPYLIRNPLFHWTHLELARFFDFHEILNEKNAEKVYDKINSKLSTESFRVHGLLKKMNVEVICTTEDPIDNLNDHKEIRNSNLDIKVGTSFRPDKAVLIENKDFHKYIEKLGEVSSLKINSYSNFKDAIKSRIDFFHDNGCRISDHGLNYIPFEDYKESDIQKIFSRRLKGELLNSFEVRQFKTAILVYLSELYFENGWVQQFHLGAMRNNNSRMYNLMGADSGWDSIGVYPITKKLSQFLDKLDSKNKLAKTILYNSNPADNQVFASIIANFNDGLDKGKIQWGSGWWFLDQIDGIRDQVNTLSNIGLISCFVGMLTDSRSFLSFPRHEYFRRILCDLFGNDIKNGLLPNDIKWSGKIISDICYYNAKNYFNL